MRISDWSSAVCSSDLDLQFSVKDHTPEGCVSHITLPHFKGVALIHRKLERDQANVVFRVQHFRDQPCARTLTEPAILQHKSVANLLGCRTIGLDVKPAVQCRRQFAFARSEEHTSELQSLMRISYAVFCLKKKKHSHIHISK